MSNILTGFNMQGNDPIDDRIVSKSNLETLEQYLKRVPVQKRYYGLTFFALDKNNELRKYTFQTSLINPTIDDNEEEIERIDKELQEHVSDKSIHKTSEEIRSEIVDADIPDTIARVQWTLDQINTAVINLIGGASDEYNTLKRIQTKIEELRAKIYGDDGSTVLNTLEQALKFLNQYKDFIVDIPENFVNKQDIVDNLTTDDPTKVLSAKQGKVLSDTLTNYFESAMQSIRTETDRAINAENRIETKLDKEIDRSTKEDQRIDSKLDSEINRSTTEDDRLDKKIDAETTRATDAESNLNTKIETETDRAESEESRIETKLDNEIARSTNKDTEHDNRLTALEGDTHEQNTDLGTTNSTFQLKYNTGNKIKHESDAISVRNAADTDYVNFIAKNATFKGDLLVEGQSFVTEAETVEIKDNLLLLNKGEVGAGVTKGIAGLEIDRGTEPNYFIIFDESDNRFKAGVEGDLWNLALRESDDNMLDGYFISWNSKDKILSTTNIVNESTPLLFGRTDYKQYSGKRTDPDGTYSSYAFISEAEGNHLYNFSGSSNWNIDTDKINFRFWKPLLGTTFKRASDNSEVLYHADIVNNLTSGGTNKVLSAEQGKLLQNSITSIQGSYLPLSGGTMTGQVIFDSYGLAFNNITWSNDLVPNRSYGGYLQVLDAYDANNAGGPTNYGTVLQVNSRNAHWANQLWFPGSKNGLYYRHMAYNETTYGEWHRLLTNKDVNIIQTQSSSNPSTLPVNQIFYSEIKGVAGTPTTNGSLFSVQGDDEGIQLWASSSRTELYYRTKWTSFGNWIKLATTSDIGNYLPLSGGTISSSKSNPLTINSTHVSQSSIDFSRGGVNKGTVGFYESLGSFLQNVTGETLAVKSDGAYYGANTDSLRKLATVTDLNNYLPLTGGIVTGDIKLNTEAALYTAASSGSGYSYYKTISYDNDKGIILGASNTSIKIQSSDPRIYHIYKGTEYEIYSTNSLPTPVFAPGKVAGSLTPIYNNSFYINDSSYRVATIDNSYSFPKIYSPTSAGTSGQILQSTGGVPTWVNASSIGGDFVSKSGDTMTGKLIAQGGISLNNIGKTGISFYKTSYVTWVEYMTNTGSGLASTGGTSSSYGNVTSLARRSTIEQTSGYGWIWDSCANSSGANPDPKMALSSNNGNLYVKGTITSNGKTVATTDQIPSIPSISISNSGSGNAVTSITASGHTLTVTKGATYLTSSSLDGYATQSWCNGQFAPLSRFNASTGYTTIKVTGQEFNFDSTNPEIYMNYRTLSGSTAVTKITWKAGGGANSTALCEGRWGNLYMNNNLVATQSWAAEKFPNKTGTGASGTWGISITGNAATATNSTQLGGTAASSYVKANDNISRLTNDSGYTTQEWVNGQGFLTSDSILDKFVPTTGGYIRNSDQVLLRLQRTGVSTGTSRTIEMYFDDSNTDGTSTTPRGSIGYNSEVGMFLYSAKSKKFLAMEYTGRPFYGTPENRYYLLASNTQYHNLDGYQRIGDIMIQWGYFTVQGNSTRAVNFSVSFTNTVWSVTGSWDNTTTGSQENWGFTDYTSSGFTIINGDGSSRVFHYIAIGPFTRS